MSKLDWVKWEAGKFLGGVVGMSIEEIGVYSVILNLIYDSGGPIKDDRLRIARRCGMRPTSFEKVFNSLLDAGKLVVSKGLISNEKAAEVLETRSKVVEKWSKNLQAANAKVEEIFKDVKGDTYPSADTGAHTASPVESESVDKKERKKDSTSSSRKAKTVNGVDYSEEFETKVWQPYPRKRGTSKHKAYQLFCMLNEINQQRVIAAIPVHAAQMRSEGRPEEKIKHLQFFISERIYETYSVSTAAGESNVVSLEWHKTATRDQWARALKIYEMDSNWRSAWGPKPGQAGCAVPQDLIDGLPYHLHPDRNRPRSQVGVAENKGPEAV